MSYIENLKSRVKQGNGGFIAPNATVIGNVQLGDKVSIWFGAVIRGDTGNISIGHRSNVQDNAVIHADPGIPAIIGENVVIGHGAIVHGAKIANNVLIGMGSIILNNAEIGEYSIIGAGTVITQEKKIPPYSIVVGNPGKIIKQVSNSRKENIYKNVQAYVELGELYLQDNMGEG